VDLQKIPRLSPTCSISVALTSSIANENPAAGKASALLVAAGVLLTKIVGLVSFRMFGHYFGLSDAADAFRAAFRIPGFLQGMFGEGVLSASFIPVYARLRAQEDDEEANRLAMSIFALLFFCISILVALGIAATPWLINGIAPGFHGAKRELTIRLVRICFPGTGLLVFSAWCLGVLNSHGKFFLSYSAPVLWHSSMIAAFLWFGTRAGGERLVEIIMWASVVGAGLQFAVQMPFVFRFVRPARSHFVELGPPVRTVLRNFGPTAVARGVTQISMYITVLMASLLSTGAVAALTNALTLYMLPLSLFGMSVYATELPAMSRVLGRSGTVFGIVSGRLARGVQRIAFFVVPSAAAFLILGKVVVATIYQTGAFGAQDVIYVWGVLAGCSVGLVAEATARVYFSALYAMQDTRTPLKIANLRVAITIVLGYMLALPLPRLIGIDRKWDAAGLTLAIGMTAWLELILLRRAIQQKFGAVPSSIARILKLWIAAVVAAIAGLALLNFLPKLRPTLTGLIVLVFYFVVYLLLTHAMGLSSVAPERGPEPS
jgi:putative peptidoglycan lipid II flippase